jgi:NADH-quinone oxidoreductase subunit G
VDYAHVMLPIGPFTETSGTFVNTEGRPQSFRGVVNPLAETRPGWKVLRVLGSMLGLAGFDYTASEQVRDEVLGPDLPARLDNRLREAALEDWRSERLPLERIGEVMMYHADAIVRRSPPLGATRDGQPPVASVAGVTLNSLGLRAGAAVRLRQGDGEAVVQLLLDERVPVGCVRVPAGHPLTAGLGPLFGPIEAAAVAVDERKVG